jgi:hypothetical protein
MAAYTRFRQAERRHQHTRSRRTRVSGSSEKLLWKVAGGFAAAVAAIAAKKAVEFVWETATGHEPPGNPEDPETTWREAMAWAVLSGTAIGVARLLAARSAAKMWRNQTGSLPPGIREVN